MTLGVINGDQKRDDFVTCPKCGGLSFVPVRHTIHQTEKKISKGVESMACLICLSKGSTTIIRR